jgi:hypothetical protein
MATLTARVSFALFVTLLAATAVRAQPAPDVGQNPDCTRMLLEAAEALRNEQYPSMAQLAAERQRDCPGPDSLFLLGIAKANMLHNGLVGSEIEPLMVAQAIHALATARDSARLRHEWLQPANAWLQYLERVQSDHDKREVQPPVQRQPPPAATPPAAAPFEPSPSYLGPLLLGSAGIVLLGAGVVTAIVAGSRNPWEDSSALDIATNFLLLSGGAALVAGLTWHLLTPLPKDTVQISLAPHLSPVTAALTLRMKF